MMKSDSCLRYIEATRGRVHVVVLNVRVLVYSAGVTVMAGGWSVTDKIETPG